MRKISAVLITYQEEKRLRKTLEALQWCDEIIVVDSGSQDQTIQIAESLGAKVFHRPFDGYGEQKYYAVNQAQHDWILALDADEVVLPNLAQEIQALMKREEIEEAGFLLARTLVFMNRKMRFGGLRGELHLRFFNRQFGNYNLNKVHEKVELQGKVGKLKGEFLHYSYEDLDDYFKRFNHYTTLAAKEKFDQKKRKKIAPFYIALRFPFSFLKLYFIRGLIGDGFPGFIWALCSAFYPVVKYTKLYEMYQQEQSS